jgi:hypothetical protein
MMVFAIMIIWEDLLVLARQDTMAKLAKQVTEKLIFFVMNRILTKNPQKALQCVLLKPCLNGGACAEDNKGGYICTCLKGFTGPTCNISNYKLCSHIYLCSNKNQFSKNKYRLSSSNSLIYRLKKC